MKQQVLNLYDNDTVKWARDGKLYCLHIWQDDMPDNPRRDWDNLDIMACWHGSYDLGDDIADTNSEDFWRRLVRENVPEAKIFEKAQAGLLNGIRLEANRETPELVDIYESYALHTVLGNTDSEENLEYEGVSKDSVAYYLLNDLTIDQCMILMEPYAEWLPLWLYDHSGITMSCGTRTYPYNDRWDSGQAGWIVALKETIMNETTDCFMDENSECKYKPLTDETWRKRAIEIMESDVKTYDQYLTNEVYGYTLYEAEPIKEDKTPDWVETDSCGGFFGSDVFANGIKDHVGCGFPEVIESGDYVCGQAKLHMHTYYTF